MARIRSVHPSLFTDEAFVALSPAARILIIGIWTECDDQGVFEWKAITLKMRIFPVDGFDVTALLSELEQGNVVKRFAVDGRPFGAVRNFGKWQRPKEPKWVYPCPEDIAAYVALRTEKDTGPDRGTALGRMLHEQQDGKCHYCKTEISFYRKKHNSLEVDHLIPVSRGGTDTVSNLAATCRDCNSLKASMTEDEFRSRFAECELAGIHASRRAKGDSPKANAARKRKVSAEGGGRREDVGEDEKKKYQFCGRVIRLTEPDYRRWEVAYSSIPDLKAELTRIDETLAEKGEKDWFVPASNMLNHKHQKNLAGKLSGRPRAAADGYVPMGNGG